MGLARGFEAIWGQVEEGIGIEGIGEVGLWGEVEVMLIEIRV